MIKGSFVEKDPRRRLETIPKLTKIGIFFNQIILTIFIKKNGNFESFAKIIIIIKV